MRPKSLYLMGSTLGLGLMGLYISSGLAPSLSLMDQYISKWIFIFIPFKVVVGIPYIYALYLPGIYFQSLFSLFSSCCSILNIPLIKFWLKILPKIENEIVHFFTQALTVQVNYQLCKLVSI
jgi:hypothetical protein